MAARAFDVALVAVLLNVLLIGTVVVKLGVMAVGGGSGVESVVADRKLSSLLGSVAARLSFESIASCDSDDGSR